MNKTELDSKHIAELHSLAADADISGYRMLPREALIEKLLDEKPSQKPPRQESRSRGERGERKRGERPPRQRRESRQPRAPREPARRDSAPAEEPPAQAPPTPPPAAESAAPTSDRPKRKRRRFRRRGRKGVRVHDLLLPATTGRQAIVYAETREGCTALLRGIAGELSGASGGPDPIGLLIDPSPEELADWRREAPQAEIVAAGQARHADDALAQAARRAGDGEDVIVLIDSLSRFAEAFGTAEEAKALFDAGLALASTGGGSLTVVAAVERLAS